MFVLLVKFCKISGNNETIVQELAFSSMWDYFKVVKESWALVSVNSCGCVSREAVAILSLNN